MNAKTILLIFTVVVLAFRVLAPQAASAEPATMFILDTSGSMWGRLDDGEPKITAARDVMGDLTSKLPLTVEAGLIAYGHRRKGDCSDIELVVPVQKAGGLFIGQQVQRLVPRGKTPITSALELAAKTLTGREDDRSMVLVSDGIETCSGDP